MDFALQIAQHMHDNSEIKFELATYSKCMVFNLYPLWFMWFSQILTQADNTLFGSTQLFRILPKGKEQ